MTSIKIWTKWLIWLIINMRLELIVLFGTALKWHYCSWYWLMVLFGTALKWHYCSWYWLMVLFGTALKWHYCSWYWLMVLFQELHHLILKDWQLELTWIVMLFSQPADVIKCLAILNGTPEQPARFLLIIENRELSLCQFFVTGSIAVCHNDMRRWHGCTIVDKVCTMTTLSSQLMFVIILWDIVGNIFILSPSVWWCINVIGIAMLHGQAFWK